MLRNEEIDPEVKGIVKGMGICGSCEFGILSIYDKDIWLPKYEKGIEAMHDAFYEVDPALRSPVLQGVLRGIVGDAIKDRIKGAGIVIGQL